MDKTITPRGYKFQVGGGATETRYTCFDSGHNYRQAHSPYEKSIYCVKCGDVRYLVTSPSLSYTINSKSPMWTLDTNVMRGSFPPSTETT